MMLRIVIVEDEPATARNLQYLLQETGNITTVAMLDSVRRSVEWFSVNPGGYDLAFMDIRLSDGLSFAIFDQVKINSPVVFVTAYDDYALPAFKANGIDYILKPFDRPELEKSLAKFRQFSSNKPDIDERITALAIQLKNIHTSYKQSFLVHYRDRLIPVATKDIAWFYTVNEVSYACTGDGRKFAIEFTLEQLQQQLHPNDFFRANRQFIVNRSAITEIEFYFNGRLLLKLDPATDEHVLVSKARVPEFKAWMNA